MLQFLNVSKSYRASSGMITALDSVSFEIEEGEFVFLVGHSGSGKTTILRQIIREELPTAGKIFFEDMEVTRLKRSGVYKLRREIGTIFQDYKLIDEKSVYENVSFAMEVAGLPNSEIKETVPYVLDIVNLADRMNSFPGELSGGEKQRVAIARAIVNNPKLLIADEPTGNLDPDSAWDVVQVLAKINKWGTTVIMATHGTEIVNSLQKRVIEMQKGKLVRDDKKGTYEEVDEYSLKVLMEQEKDITDSEKTEEKLAKSSEDDLTTIIKLTSDKKTSKKDKKTEESEQVEESKEETKLEQKKKEKTEENDDIKIIKMESEAATPDDSQEKREKAKEEKTLDKIIHKADTTGLTTLKLAKKLEDKLKEHGYKDVEDILAAGVGEVNKGLSNTEVRQLARAIKRFVTTE